MAITGTAEHLKRYRALARLAWKYGRGDLVSRAGLDAALAPEDRDDAAPPPEAAALADDLERMGATYVKLGQLLSTRPDLVPPAYAEALGRLQDRVEPFPAEEAEAIVQAELGVRLSKAFAHFEREPLAAASLGQVHRARLRDGRPVAVKVQRPGVREQVLADLEVLGEVVALADRHTEAGRRYEPGRAFEEMRRTLLDELDYLREADNLARMAASLEEFERILVPLPVADYTTARVLTMDHVRGRKVTALSPLAKLEMDGDALAEELFRAYLKQILIDGFFHADPHPGNVFLTDDRRIALLDLGMVGRLGTELQRQLVRLVLAVSEGNGQEAAEVTISMGRRRDGADLDAFTDGVMRVVGEFQAASASRGVEVGRVMLDVFRTAADNGIRLPSENATLGRALLALDRVGRALAPEFDPNASIRRNAAELMRRRMLKELSPQRVLGNALEMNELVQRLPGRINRALDTVAQDGLEVKVRVPEEVWMLEGMQAASNRITLGLIVAALVLGAAMLMRVQTRFTVLGYPGIAMILFLVGTALGLYVVIRILLDDLHKRRP